MTTRQKPPYKQHTIPDFYLKRFADNNSYVWVYDREKKELRKQPSKDTTIERDFYTFQVKKGPKIYTIETDILAKSIESRADKVIRNLEVNILPLSVEERRDLCEFITMQYLRTTAFRRDVNYSFEQFSRILIRMRFGNKDRAQKTIDNYEESTGEKLGLSAEEGMKFIKDNNYGIQIPKEYHLTMMLESFNEFYEIFFRMNWIFVKAMRNNLFLTSDNPMSVLRFGAKPYVPYHISHAEITLPLTPVICLYMYEYGNITSWHDGNDKIVNNFNLRTIRFSDRYIISKKRKQLVELVKISKIDSIPRKPAVKIDSPF